MVEKTVSFGLHIARSATEPGWVTVWIRKQFWSLAGGSRSRHVATTGFYAEGMGEREILEASLREMLRALADDLA